MRAMHKQQSGHARRKQADHTPHAPKGANTSDAQRGEAAPWAAQRPLRSHRMPRAHAGAQRGNWHSPKQALVAGPQSRLPPTLAKSVGRDGQQQPLQRPSVMRCKAVCEPCASRCTAFAGTDVPVRTRCTAAPAPAPAPAGAGAPRAAEPNGAYAKMYKVSLTFAWSQIDFAHRATLRPTGTPVPSTLPKVKVRL